MEKALSAHHVQLSAVGAPLTGPSFSQIADIVKAVGNCSYNQLVEKIICCKQSDNSELVDEGGWPVSIVNTRDWGVGGGGGGSTISFLNG